MIIVVAIVKIIITTEKNNINFCDGYGGDKDGYADSKDGQRKIQTLTK